MPLTASQQYWQNEYQTLKVVQDKSRATVTYVLGIDSVDRTAAQTAALKLAQEQQIKAEVGLIKLQENLDKPMLDQINWIDKRIASGALSSFEQAQLASNKISLLQARGELSSLRQSWDIPAPGSTSYVIGNYVHSNNGTVRPDGTTVAGAALYLWNEVTTFVSGAASGAQRFVIDLTNSKLDPALMNELCKGNYELVGKIGSALLPEGLRLPGDLGKQAARYLGEAAEKGAEVGSGACKIWIKKEDFLKVLGELSGEQAPSSGVDPLSWTLFNVGIEGGSRCPAVALPTRRNSGRS